MQNTLVKNFRHKLIGDKAFYKMVFLIAFPIIIQNGITNFVNLLDNIMVGRLGTELMSGVAIVNQLFMVFNICLFGAVSASSIFSSQFFGQGNNDGVRSTFRFKLICCLSMTILGIIILLRFGSELISLYLHDAGDGDIAMTHQAGMQYLHIMLIGMIPCAMTQVYASTLRETGETMKPMLAGVAAVCVDLVFNYLLIFGRFGFPYLGVRGAATATVLARFVEMFIVMIWTHTHSDRYIFIKGAYKSLYVPGKLMRMIIIKGMPLFINELLWSVGQAALVQCYSIRGLDAVAAFNISSIVSNLFNVVFIALGSAISIVIGRLLGAGDMERAVDTNRKMIFCSVASCFFIGAILIVLAPLFPMIYKTSDTVRALAASLIRVSSVCMPLYAFYHATYFTLRAGGKTFIAFLFDGCYVWVISIPVAFMLSRFTGWNIIAIFASCQAAEIMKAVLGFILLKKGIWLNNIVEDC